MTSWTREALTHETMVRQGLSSRRPSEVIDAVRSVLALQAQEPAALYLSLWNRIDDFDPSDLDRALADGAIVKASLFRFSVGACDHRTADATPNTVHAVRRQQPRRRSHPRTGHDCTGATLCRMAFKLRAVTDTHALADDQIQRRYVHVDKSTGKDHDSARAAL